MPQDKLRQDKEAGKHLKQKEMQQESNRLGDIRREIEMERGEMDMGMEIHKDKEKKAARIDKIHGKEEIRLREQRRAL